MIKRKLKLIGMSAVLVAFLTGITWATQLTLEQQNPSGTIYVNDTFYVDIKADVDVIDPIMGFGFDLSFDDGASFITLPGDSSPILSFNSFIANSALGFSYDPFMVSDADTISGMLGLFDPGISGSDLLLGTLEFTALSAGIETLFLGADDIGTAFSTEGLIPDWLAVNSGAVMPNNPTLSLTINSNSAPEPSTFMLFGLGLLAVASRRKK